MIGREALDPQVNDVAEMGPDAIRALLASFDRTGNPFLSRAALRGPVIP